MTGNIDMQTNRLKFGNYAQICRYGSGLAIYDQENNTSDVGSEGNCKAIFTHGSFRPGDDPNYSIGSQNYRWPVIYANKLNVTSQELVTNLNANFLNGYKYTDFTLFKKFEIDTTKLDENTWYPVTMPTNAYLRVVIKDTTATTASWNTRSDNLMGLFIDWETNSSGWGRNSVERVINHAIYGSGASEGKPVRGIGQMTNSSTEYVYVRGGAKYNFYVSDYNSEPILRTETYEIREQSISPTTTAPAVINRTNMLTTDVSKSYNGNIDDIVDTGIYKLYSQTTGTKPASMTSVGGSFQGCNLEHFLLDGNTAQQVLFNYSASKVCVRFKKGGYWGDWQDVITTDTLSNYATTDNLTDGSVKKVGGLKYVYFEKKDNSGKPTYLLLADVTKWYTVNTADAHFLQGILIGSRYGNNDGCRTTIINARCQYQKQYNLLQYSNNNGIYPRVVLYNDKYYLALFLKGSGFNVRGMVSMSDDITFDNELLCKDTAGNVDGLTVVLGEQPMGIAGNADTATTATNANIARGLNGYTTAGDLNNIKTNSIYGWNNNTANIPSGENYGVVFQFSNVDSPTTGTSGHWINQIAYTTNDRMYYRQCINTGNWSNWKQIVNSNDLSKALLNKNRLPIGDWNDVTDNGIFEVYTNNFGENCASYPEGVYGYGQLLVFSNSVNNGRISQVYIPDVSTSALNNPTNTTINIVYRNSWINNGVRSWTSWYKLATDKQIVNLTNNLNAVKATADAANSAASEAKLLAENNNAKIAESLNTSLDTSSSTDKVTSTNGTNIILTQADTIKGSVTLNGTSNQITATGGANNTITFAIASNAALPGAPTTTTAAAGSSDTKIATTAFVQNSITNGKAASAATADVANKAGKLSTAQKIWGQSFDGSAAVSGNMSNVGSIDFNNGYSIAPMGGGLRIMNPIVSPGVPFSIDDDNARINTTDEISLSTSDLTVEADQITLDCTNILPRAELPVSNINYYLSLDANPALY